MNPKDILRHSKQAYNQWAKQWREHAVRHSKFQMKPMHDFNNIGIGKAILCVANGYSFEEHIELIHQYRGNVDILACDKTMGHLLDHGITPTYVMVCDANVSFDKYMAKWKDKLKDTILFNNVCGNPRWSEEGNWKDRYFYVNMDVLNSEQEFSKLSGCQNMITAGTNVSNMMVVLLTQSDNTMRRNFFGYDKIALIGYDYSWRPDGKYYAFDREGRGKFHFMRHIQGLGTGGKIIFTSNNLSASASWLEKYISVYKLPVVQCSPHSVQNFTASAELESQLRYGYRREDRATVLKLLGKKNQFEAELKKVNDNLKNIGRDHHYAHMATI